jgi:pyridoxal phosphate enzyme (YggS family)
VVHLPRLRKTPRFCQITEYFQTFYVHLKQKAGKLNTRREVKPLGYVTHMFHHHLNKVRQNILAAMQKAARPASELPTLVAVSKTHPPAALREAIAHGVRLFGESKVQEAKAKIPLLPTSCRWHFIGHLQKNKIRQALPLFELFHGVDSLQTAKEMDRIAGELGLFPRILLEVNLAGEASKFGFPKKMLQSQFESLLHLPRLQIEGLMTIPPPAVEPDLNRRFFSALRNLRDTLVHDFGTPLPALSMGMSDDYQVAVEEGATLIRIGSALFGARHGTAWKPTTADSLDE